MTKISQMMIDLDEASLLKQLRSELEKGEDPLDILEQCREGMKQVGSLFEEGEYYISELMMAGELFKEVSAVILPHLANTAAESSRGQVVIGTVQDDLHHIGKDIVVTILRGANYEVNDLGVDVPAHRFAETVVKTGARVVGLSCLLTVAFDRMKETVSALRELPFPVKVMIGGGPVTENICNYVGADALGRDAQAAVNICNRWLSDRESENI